MFTFLEIPNCSLRALDTKLNKYLWKGEEKEGKERWRERERNGGTDRMDAWRGDTEAFWAQTWMCAYIGLRTKGVLLGSPNLPWITGVLL